MPRVDVDGVGTFEVEEGKRLILAIEEDAGVDIMHRCGGYARCTTCRVEYLEGGRGLPLGTGVSPGYRQAVAELPHGSVLVFYSDGLIERRGRSLDEGLERLRASVATGPRDPERLAEHVLEHLIGDDDRRDDVVLLVARLLPVAPRSLSLQLGGGDAGLRHLRELLVVHRARVLRLGVAHLSSCAWSDRAYPAGPAPAGGEAGPWASCTGASRW